MAMHDISCVEDHAQLVNTLTQSLGALGIHVHACGDGMAADTQLQRHAFDVVVLDLALPRMGGIDILRRLRQRGDTVPVLVLTASGEIQTVCKASMPAPTITCPSRSTCRSWPRACARCTGAGSAPHSVVRVTRLEFDTLSRRFSLSGQPLELPPREHDLLEALVVHPGRPVSKGELAERLRTDDAVLSPEALEVYVHRLRRRLEGSGAAIHTLRGLGYVLEAERDAAA